jgi:hypothetical protein
MTMPRIQASLQTPCLAKLDVLAWPAGTVVDSYGVRLGIRCSSDATLRSVLALLPPGTIEVGAPDVGCLFSVVAGDEERVPGRPRRLSLAYQEHVQLARERTLAPVLDVLRGFMRMHIAEHAPDRVFVHAGVVGWRGRAIVVPGRSFTGKSTLVGELVRLGATYLSDEYAVLDGDGRVHPFAKPLSLRPAGSYAGVDHPVAVQGNAPLPVGAIVSAPFEPGARWAPTRTSSGAGALALLENAPGARRSPARVLAAVRSAATAAAVFEGPRGEAARTAHDLLATLSDQLEAA